MARRDSKDWQSREGSSPVRRIRNSYNMDTRALAHLLREGAKRPRAINELSARASML